QMFRPSVLHPLIWARPRESALGRDDQSAGVRMQGFGDNLLAHSGAISIRCIYESDPQVDCAAQKPDSIRAIGWLAPDSVAGDSHGSEPQSRDAQITSNRKFTSLLNSECSLIHKSFQ